MNTNRKYVLVLGAVLAIASLVVVACNDDSGTSNGTTSGNPFNNPGTDSGTTSSGGNDSGPTPGTDGGCPNKPAGCFCGTPTTQKEFLNRCTNAAALPVNLTPKPATTTDIP